MAWIQNECIWNKKNIHILYYLHRLTITCLYNLFSYNSLKKLIHNILFIPSLFNTEMILVLWLIHFLSWSTSLFLKVSYKYDWTDFKEQNITCHIHYTVWEYYNKKQGAIGECRSSCDEMKYPLRLAISWHFNCFLRS